MTQLKRASQVVLLVKEPACQCRSHKKLGFDPWVRKSPWRRVHSGILIGESHGPSGMEGYSPQGHKESDRTEAT